MTSYDELKDDNIKNLIDCAILNEATSQFRFLKKGGYKDKEVSAAKVAIAFAYLDDTELFQAMRNEHANRGDGYIFRLMNPREARAIRDEALSNGYYPDDPQTYRETLADTIREYVKVLLQREHEHKLQREHEQRCREEEDMLLDRLDPDTAEGLKEIRRQAALNAQRIAKKYGYHNTPDVNDLILKPTLQKRETRDR